MDLLPFLALLCVLIFGTVSDFRRLCWFIYHKAGLYKPAFGEDIRKNGVFLQRKLIRVYSQDGEYLLRGTK